MSYTIWTRTQSTLQIEGVQAAIVAFALVCSRAYPKEADATIGFKPSKVAGTIPCIEGWVTTRDDPNMHLVAILFDVTVEDWKRYGPPDSIALSETEMRERGLGSYGTT